VVVGFVVLCINPHRIGLISNYSKLTHPLVAYCNLRLMPIGYAMSGALSIARPIAIPTTNDLPLVMIYVLLKREFDLRLWAYFHLRDQLI
jgi:hypothetical protein